MRPDDENADPNVFFLNGPGGVGKTFVYKTLLHHARHRTEDDVANDVWHVALATPSNGQPKTQLKTRKNDLFVSPTFTCFCSLSDVFVAESCVL